MTEQPKAASQSTLSKSDRTALFGFWVYLMTDCVLFASLFATYWVLHNNTYDGVSSRDLFRLPFALSETLILLTSSFTCGLAMVAAYRQQLKQVLIWFGLTFMLGVSFLTMELTEFRPAMLRKLTMLGLFWHFLDIVWIFIFSVVYLMGVS
ncbi:cytochrome o ubiquinol oxidase subunit III [Candidatus Saccharibacteria bacterium]|nr:cytochrome o ubiquinol oxidase subunit III [Candidatus Saccharibacteria bacterium]